MGELTFSDDAWRDYLYWQTQDRKTLKRINLLIQSVQRDGPANGPGKPERLKYASGSSRHIDDKNRLLYEMRDGSVYISACLGHYGDEK